MSIGPSYSGCYVAGGTDYLTAAKGQGSPPRRAISVPVRRASNHEISSSSWSRGAGRAACYLACSDISQGRMRYPPSSHRAWPGHAWRAILIAYACGSSGTAATGLPDGCTALRDFAIDSELVTSNAVKRSMASGGNCLALGGAKKDIFDILPFLCFAQTPVGPSEIPMGRHRRSGETPRSAPGAWCPRQGGARRRARQNRVPKPRSGRAASPRTPA